MKKDMTSKDLITLLPFESEFQKDLLERYDHMDEDELYTVDQVLWSTYNGLFDIQLQTNLKTVLYDLKDSEDKIKQGIYEEVYKKTLEEFPQELSKIAKDLDLSTTREKLEKVIEASDKN